MASTTENPLVRVAALAGRRPDASDADAVRFPLKNISSVKAALTKAFVGHKLTHLVCAAACGADLVALEVANELGIESYIVLPFVPVDFRKISVVDRPGDWGGVFDREVEKAKVHGRLRVLGCAVTDETAFSKTTQAIIDQASQLGGTFPVFAVVVWEGQSRGEGDTTEEFAILSQKSGLHKIEISTL